MLALPPLEGERITQTVCRISHGPGGPLNQKADRCVRYPTLYSLFAVNGSLSDTAGVYGARPLPRPSRSLSHHRPSLAFTGDCECFVLPPRLWGCTYACHAFLVGNSTERFGVPALSALPSPHDAGRHLACATRVHSAHIRVRQVRSHLHKTDGPRPDENR
jgi:hypothetical protein